MMNVLITGASSGLGASLKYEFEQRGQNVFGTTHDPKFVSEESQMLYWDPTTYGNEHELAVALSRSSADRFHVLINNAGINAIKKFEHLTSGFLRDVMTVNFAGPIFLTQQLLARGTANLNGGLQSGAVVCNIISDAAWRPMRHSLAYNCSKAALDMATKQMARELTKPYNLTIFGVRPGKMAGTGMSHYIDQQVCEMRGWTSEQAHEYFKANSVTGQEFSTILLAKLIADLCTSRLPLSGACLDLCG